MTTLRYLGLPAGTIGVVLGLVLTAGCLDEPDQAPVTPGDPHHDWDGDGYCEEDPCDEGLPGDCDDTDADVYPGASESCDGVDNDCDGDVDNDAACELTITGIDGEGTSSPIVDEDGVISGIAGAVESLHRFQEAWVVTGTGLDTVTACELVPDGWSGPTFDQADGLEFELGGTDMERTLSLPTGLVAGAFILTLTSPAATASAQVSVLQGEQGPPGESELACSGDDCTLDFNLVVNGDVSTSEDVNVDGHLSGASADFSGQGSFGMVEVGELSVTSSYGLPECPEGYDVSQTTPFVLCDRLDGSGDQIVQVGDFWIYRYEMSVWENSDCTGQQYGDPIDLDNYPSGFPDNGNYTTEVYACSISDGITYPSASMTWFQAQQACALSGKMLCTNDQWQAAAAGTPDDDCNISSASVEYPGDYTGCESAWGAMDMAGNLWEWVALWEGHPGFNGAANIFSAEYGEDSYVGGGPDYNSMAAVGSDGSWRTYATGMIDGGGDSPGEYYGPAAAIRGGMYSSSTRAGVFSLNLGDGPSCSPDIIGARCCQQR